MIRFVLAVSLISLAAACSDPEPAVTGDQEGVLASSEILPSSTTELTSSTVESATSDTTSADPETLATFAQIRDAAEAEAVGDRPFGEIVQWVGEQLMGRPYAAGLLDAPESETLVVDLRQFDCVLYVENVIALAQSIALGETDYEAYAERVETLRYREGTMGGYCSRLHYFTEWIHDNDTRGTVQNVTQQIGGESFDKQIDFMSEHRESYPKLESDETYACIVDMEEDLRSVELFYIPQARIAEAYAMMQPGDVIATATSIGGLDVTHTGFVHQTEAGTGFMHASLSSNAVKVSPDLEDYVQGIRSQIGVVVARPLDPR